jgi:phosphopantothenoylcysteine decarboxylase / phosphopantothenate---cysteine ligase
MLKGKKILVGVTGGIAAYKTATVVRLLVKDGAEVRVIMTDHAKDFVTPLTFSTLSGNPVLIDFFNRENGSWNSHVDLGIWAELFLIAPATANTIAKMASGVADNLLLTSYLSARCPVVIAPSMDMDMLGHKATQENLRKLSSYGNSILDAPSGELASGLSGKGRMAEPEDIATFIRSWFSKKKTLSTLRDLKS